MQIETLSHGPKRGWAFLSGTARIQLRACSFSRESGGPGLEKNNGRQLEMSLRFGDTPVWEGNSRQSEKGRLVCERKKTFKKGRRGCRTSRSQSDLRISENVVIWRFSRFYRSLGAGWRNSHDSRMEWEFCPMYALLSGAGLAVRHGEPLP